MAAQVSPEQISAIERLIALITPDPAVCEEQIARFREQFKDEEEDIQSGTDLVWLLKDVVDWQSGFFVDWKDTESFIQCLEELSAARDVEIDWQAEDPLDEDFLDSVDVDELLARASDSLESFDLRLWTWDTEGDCYGGWIARKEDSEEIDSIGESLEVEFFDLSNSPIDDAEEDSED